MLTKLKINLIAILMCVCLTSVGFSAWTITGASPSVSISSSINVDQVINSNDYIKLNSFEAFTFCSDGFIVNSAIAYSEDIVAEYSLNVNNCKQLLGNNVTITFNLCYTNDVTFSNYSVFSLISSMTVNFNGNTTKYNYSQLTDQTHNYVKHVISLNLQNISGDKIPLTITYGINEDENAAKHNFETYIISSLCPNKNANPIEPYEFKIDTIITGA